MFDQRIVEARMRQLYDAGFTNRAPLREVSPQEAEEMTRRLDEVWNPQLKGPAREFTPEEARFVINERLMVQASYRYFAERYCKINVKGGALRNMYPLLDSQEFILKRLAEEEWKIHEGGREDGLLVNLLKGARQIGGSTLAESVGAYIFTTREHIFGLVAADVPETSAFMFDMFERMVENLPWWLSVGVVNHVKDKEMLFETQSHIWVGSGRSTRGTEGQRGQLGRAKSLTFVHLSELSTWEEAQAKQIGGSLLPTMHPEMRPFALFESTAKGRDNWWHKHWKVSAAGKNRFVNLFIPWYVERSYKRNPPSDWTPAPATLAHAKHCEDTSARYLGKTVQLTKEQLFWYEFTRTSYEEMDDLKTFIEEFGSVTDDETFQHSGYSIFTAKVQQRIRDQSRPILGVVEIKPQRELR